MKAYSSNKAFACATRAACAARWAAAVAAAAGELATAVAGAAGGSCECTLLNAKIRSCKVCAYARHVRRVHRQRTLLFSGNTFSA